MPRKRHKPEEIIAKLRQVDVMPNGWLGNAMPRRYGGGSSSRGSVAVFGSSPSGRHAVAKRKGPTMP
jgi:hypothetical protein